MIASQRSRQENPLGAAIVALVLVIGGAMPVKKAWTLPNPASVFCVESGGKSEMRQKPSGGVYGVCRLPDGRVVEEWTYFRKMKAKRGSGR